LNTTRTRFGRAGGGVIERREAIGGSSTFEGKGGLQSQQEEVSDALALDTKAGLQALHQALSSECWWDWTHGYSLLFWRCDALTQLKAARDGMEIFVQGPLFTIMKPAQSPPSDKAAQMGPKVDKVRNRNYIRAGPVYNLTDYSDVPKGESDIRIVHNGTSSGLNEALWAPSLFLPNSDSAARLLMYHSFTVDADLGEMF
jgi:hypothetical protein